jgi:arylsulfatase A-like enzyme
MPHVPIFCSAKFEGKSGAGLYGDVMMEIDWSVGQIAKALRDNLIEDNTLVVFTSDNGPWIAYGNHAGSTPFREAKATGFDGGIRSACIVKWPGHVKPATRSRKAFCSIDFLPTFAKLAGAELPDNPIDGKDICDILVDKPGVANPHEYYPFSTGNTFEGVVSGDGRWKLHLPHKYRSLVTPGADGQPGKYTQKTIELSLFDLDADPCELKNVMDEYPDVAQRLHDVAKAHRKTFYAKPTR